jgi:predicted nucleic acid-binding protein
MGPSPSPSSRRVFVDTGAYYAVAEADDADYRDALSIANQIEASRLRPFTTNFVPAETHALLLNRLGRAVALRVLQDLDRSQSLIAPRA